MSVLDDFYNDYPEVKNFVQESYQRGSLPQAQLAGFIKFMHKKSSEYDDVYDTDVSEESLGSTLRKTARTRRGVEALYSLYQDNDWSENSFRDMIERAGQVNPDSLAGENLDPNTGLPFGFSVGGGRDPAEDRLFSELTATYMMAISRGFNPHDALNMVNEGIQGSEGGLLTPERLVRQLTQFGVQSFGQASPSPMERFALYNFGPVQMQEALSSPLQWYGSVGPFSQEMAEKVANLSPTDYQYLSAYTTGSAQAPGNYLRRAGGIQTRLPAGSVDASGKKTGGQFSGYLMAESVQQKFGEALKKILLDRYDKLITSSGLDASGKVKLLTGSLRKALEDAKVIFSQDGENGVLVKFDLADVTRPARYPGDRAISTLAYSAWVFGGRGVVYPRSRTGLTFMPRRGEWGGVTVRTKSVQPSKPVPVFDLQDQDLTTLGDSFLQTLARSISQGISQELQPGDKLGPRMAG